MKTTEKENIYKTVGIEKKESIKEEEKETILSGLLFSLKSGVFAFAIVFTFSIISKSIAYTSGSSQIFNVNINDVLLSFWAFLIFSFTVFVSKFCSIKE